MCFAGLSHVHTGCLHYCNSVYMFLAFWKVHVIAPRNDDQMGL